MLALVGCSVAPPGDSDSQTESSAATQTGSATETGSPTTDAPACDEDECGPWETCSDPFGVCEFDCLATSQPAIDPPGSCEIHLVEFPEVLIGFTYVDVDGVRYGRADDCADEVEQDFPFWVWTVEGETIRLCEMLCSLYEASPDVEVGVQCESA